MHRALGALDLTAIGVGGIIGAGIFVLTGQAAAQYAGPAIVLSFLLAGLACGFAGLCYAELASMIPVAGSAYTYSYATLGEVVAWFIGWDLVLEYVVGAAAVAVGWSGYVVSFLRGFGVDLPPEIIAAPGTEFVFVDAAQIAAHKGLSLTAGWHALEPIAKSLAAAGVSVAALPHKSSVFNVPAVAIVALVTLVLTIGIRESARFNAVIVVLKVTVILLVIGVGFAYIRSEHWTPFLPPNTGKFGQFGVSGVLRGAGVIFFAYIGFDAVSTAAQETKNPQRDLPIGILASLVICTVLYILVSLVLTGVVDYHKLAVADPIAVGIDAMGVKWLAVVVKLGAIAGLSSVVLVLMMAQPRVFYSMARDGLLPRFFSQLHPRFKTPHKTTILTGIIVSGLAGAAPIGLLGELVSIGTLAAFTIVCAGVLVLRRRSPDIPRAFKTPLVPLVPVLGMASCIYLMAGLPLDTWLRLAIWMAIGMGIYFTYGRKRSLLNPARPD